MPEDDWDARLFVERLRGGAFNGRILETLGALSSDQLHEVDDVLDEGGDVVPENLKRSG